MDKSIGETDDPKELKAQIEYLKGKLAEAHVVDLNASEAVGVDRELRDLMEELESYGHRSTLWVVNRDGDKYFIECPNCHSTEVDKVLLFGCKNCKEHFSLHSEDGLKSIRILDDHGPVSSRDEEIKLIKLDPDAYAHQQIHGRNEGKVEELLKKFPRARLITIEKDLNRGRDAHGHAEYKRYALIPLLSRPDIADIKEVLKYLMKEDLARKDFTNKERQE